MRGTFSGKALMKLVLKMQERVMIGSQLLSVISTLSRRRLIRIRAQAVPLHSVTCSGVLSKRSRVRAYQSAVYAMRHKARRMFWF
ncbi:hypothetical protein AYM40_30465 [Paraburkholderia phytofirmans OLGA172]|uniref:Uncharacterized protein n=1 Tax=Paraburkholderia phytofirmans OLGA172 TaxID=1417228 RepID=A0A167WG81_9BURK|nr:hypothetical protein AYM40_30465 [Paraburkholderia phytofirmans OLGA172]